MGKTQVYFSPKIMVVDDEENVLKALRRELESNGLYNVQTFFSPESALIYANIHPINLVITDYKMPYMHGLTFLKRLVQLQPLVATIVLSGNAGEALRHSQFNGNEIKTLLHKPWHRPELLALVAGTLANTKNIDDK